MKRRVPTSPRTRASIVLAGALLAVAAGAGIALASSSAGSRSAVGQPPPEIAEAGDAWPAHNYDLANSRATTSTAITAANVGTLAKTWSFTIPGTGPFGNFATTPIAFDGVVYFQDLNSNVYAVDQQTGKLRWKRTFKSPTIGPNGVALGYGRLYGATSNTAFALDPDNGKVLWKHRLARTLTIGVDMAPQVYDGKVLISTVPGGDVQHFYRPGAAGVVYALDAASGRTIWSFDTVDRARNAETGGGGGLWYPPAVGTNGDVYLAVANPSPWPNSPKNRNGSLHPGRNLYTDSLVVLDGATGKPKWFRQVVAHDVRDYDLMISPVLYTPAAGAQLVIGAGKMGKVFAWNAANGKTVWQANVGRHLNDTGPLPNKPVTVCPGDFGGVETPMAQADGTLFVPWLNLCVTQSATSLSMPEDAFAKATGGLTAFDAATGKVKWQRALPRPNFGAATVASDVVFTSDFTGKIYAFSTATGKRLWTAQAPAGVNAFPAITDRMVLVGAGTPGLGTNPKPHYALVAYELR